MVRCEGTGSETLRTEDESGRSTHENLWATRKHSSATSDHVKAEVVLINGVGCLGTLVKDTAGRIHALACGVPDRELNETKYLKDALDMINVWQPRCSRRRSESRDGQETTVVILVERPQ